MRHILVNMCTYNPQTYVTKHTCIQFMVNNSEIITHTYTYKSSKEDQLVAHLYIHTHTHIYIYVFYNVNTNSAINITYRHTYY